MKMAKPTRRRRSRYSRKRLLLRIKKEFVPERSEHRFWFLKEKFMNAVTVTEAKRNLERIIERVIADAEPTIVVAESRQQAVFVSLDEYNSWKETLYLLSNPANAEHLRASIAEAKAGEVVTH
jgi:antitoxin YefM